MNRQARMLLRRTWVPIVLASAVALGVVVGLPWYYKEYRGATPDRGLTPVELEWARAYGPWRTQVASTLELAYDNRNSVDGELGDILDRIAGCGDRLWTEIGAPPSERLDPVAQRAATACASADAALEEYRAAGNTPSWRTSARLLGATDAIRGAEVSLRQLLLAQRPLERAGGPAEERSRIEPRLSDRLSTEHPTEVLCWSEEEWPQVQAELVAVGLEQSQPLRSDVNVYRFRVHASPRVCSAVGRIAYSEAPAADGEAALALLAVLHAAQHAVAGVTDEQEAECLAVARVGRSAHSLGAPRAVAEELEGLARGASGCP